MAATYRRSHNLPGTSTVQRALEALVQDELVERYGSGYRIAEPFLTEWIVRSDV
jgi:DNA-binding GntR family transcriptional regulator